MDSNRIFAGVDCSAGARHLTVAARSHCLEVKFLRELSMEDAVEELSSFGAISVAVGGPLRPNPSSAAAGSPAGEARRGKTVLASEPEAEIRRGGISIRRWPTEEEAAPAAMRAVCLPETVTWLGRDSNYCICLPTKELLDKYLKSDYHG
jgi:hypothetical protein